MSLCYHSSRYRWISIAIFISASIAVISLLGVDISMDQCNDSYHNIEPCLNSTTCDVRYCEETICSNYTCIPRIKKWCVNENIIFYPDGKCPEEKMYKTSIIVLVLTLVICLDCFIFLVTIIHYRYNYHYDEMYHDDGASDGRIRNPNNRKIKCSSCNGIGDDIVRNDKCNHYNGKGYIVI